MCATNRHAAMYTDVSAEVTGMKRSKSVAPITLLVQTIDK